MEPIKTKNDVPNKIIVAIYPTREGFGYAVFEKPTELLDFGVSNFRKNSNANKEASGFQKLTALLDFYQPEIVITENIKACDPRRSKPAIRFCDRVAKYCRQHNIGTRLYGAGDVSEVFAVFGAEKKFSRARLICKWLPELTPRCVPYRRAWQSEHYRIGIFQAIALIIVYYYREY